MRWFCDSSFKFLRLSIYRNWISVEILCQSKRLLVGCWLVYLTTDDSNMGLLRLLSDGGCNRIKGLQHNQIGLAQTDVVQDRDSSVVSFNLYPGETMEIKNKERKLPNYVVW